MPLFPKVRSVLIRPVFGGVRSSVFAATARLDNSVVNLSVDKRISQEPRIPVEHVRHGASAGSKRDRFDDKVFFLMAFFVTWLPNSLFLWHLVVVLEQKKEKQTDLMVPSAEAV